MQLIHRTGGHSEILRTDIPDEGLTLRRSSSGVELVRFQPVRRKKARAHEAAHVLPFVENELRRAVLVVVPGVRDLYVGGRRPTDVRVLVEREEIVIGAGRVYFTARTPLAVARHDGDASCGVCGDSARGCDAITCTHCSAVTHAGTLAEGGERQCFEHRGSCPGCGLRADDFEWTPDGDDRD